MLENHADVNDGMYILLGPNCILTKLKVNQPELSNQDDWKWISAILTATKLMVVNDPATMELGPQGTIASGNLNFHENSGVLNRSKSEQ